MVGGLPLSQPDRWPFLGLPSLDVCCPFSFRPRAGNDCFLLSALGASPSLVVSNSANMLQSSLLNCPQNLFLSARCFLLGPQSWVGTGEAERKSGFEIPGGGRWVGSQGGVGSSGDAVREARAWGTFQSTVGLLRTDSGHQKEVTVFPGQAVDLGLCLVS